ncbi:O-antigen ligase family protein [Verminephrobacter aporrectodeae subsp. tuberculatae]|uniref:O-antigen ligase family protein n=1 Tax=Verminephrobacter aporrectodeae TaxID=1110389 RepID=UPI0022439BC7|nr:O-antigen ligase family protein [Verminephrobacter aporrectodeae]MCW8166308.1 O-antigen ligase family protein [Verminephrobacter aporrectodeae subsp. tuberculatae]MCW8170403.1 O-antigen ligase family protein [Verminephrobacter aporrectodeae subsp. tuberculatae]
MRAHRWFGRCANCGACMLPGLALWLPSGYSFGAALLLLAALVSVPVWCRRRAPRAACWLAAAFCAMAALWLLDVGVAWGWGSLDRPAKYLLALPCIFYLMAFAPRASWLWMGVALGSIGSGLLGFFQTQVLDLPRANGFTNAIQYGNLSMLLALMSGLVLGVQWPRWLPWQRLLLVSAVLLGGAGSLLSQSRGGWLALALLLPVGAWLLVRTTGQRWVYGGLCALVLVAAALTQLPGVKERVGIARQEVQTYQESGESSSSVGQRLAHWRLAWEMGRDRPFIGWGRAGYMQEKARRVAAGLAPPSVLDYGHAHNEFLDLFVKRGLFGVLVLMGFYGVPLALFWPTAARIRDAAGNMDRQSLSLCLAGVLLPLSYIGFGLTQVFLAHNSGNVFYLFMCPLLLAALHRRQVRRTGVIA